jgi:hypothetical protein
MHNYGCHTSLAISARLRMASSSTFLTVVRADTKMEMHTSLNNKLKRIGEVDITRTLQRGEKS